MALARIAAKNPRRIGAGPCRRVKWLSYPFLSPRLESGYINVRPVNSPPRFSSPVRGLSRISSPSAAATLRRSSRAIIWIDNNCDWEDGLIPFPPPHPPTLLSPPKFLSHLWVLHARAHGGGTKREGILVFFTNKELRRGMMVSDEKKPKGDSVGLQ